MGKAVRAFKTCYICKRENPPEGFYSNGYCRPCGAAYYRERRKKDPDRIRAQHRAHYYRHQDQKIKEAIVCGRNLKIEVVGHYGGRCACCGELRMEFLVIDHTNGGGNEHRRSLFGSKCSASKMYKWLKSNNYPEGFRVLCHNCNMSFGLLGYCPHKSPEKEYANPETWKRQKSRNGDSHRELPGGSGGFRTET